MDDIKQYFSKSTDSGPKVLTTESENILSKKLTDCNSFGIFQWVPSLNNINQYIYIMVVLSSVQGY